MREDGFGDLQDESGKTDQASQASAGNLGSTGRRNRGALGGREAASAGGLGGLRRRGGGRRSVVAAAAGVALNNLGGGDRDLDGALVIGAVGNGQGGGLGDSVRLGTLDDLGGLRAVGGQSSDDLGGVGDVGEASRDAGGGGSGKDDSGELHFVWGVLSGLYKETTILLFYGWY